jgi:hypothetical protein
MTFTVVSSGECGLSWHIVVVCGVVQGVEGEAVAVFRSGVREPISRFNNMFRGRIFSQAGNDLGTSKGQAS